MAVHITYLISPSSSLSCHTTIIKDILLWEYNKYKLLSCVNIIHIHHSVFSSLCSESTRPTDSCFQGTTCENLMMYGGLYQHTRVVLYICITSLCGPTVVIWLVIRPCDIDVHYTHLVSHSASLCCQIVIEAHVGSVINTVITYLI